MYFRRRNEILERGIENLGDATGRFDLDPHLFCMMIRMMMTMVRIMVLMMMIRMMMMVIIMLMTIGMMMMMMRCSWFLTTTCFTYCR